MFCSKEKNKKYNIGTGTTVHSVVRGEKEKPEVRVHLILMVLGKEL